MTNDSLWLTPAFSVSGVTSESCLLLGKVLMAQAGSQSEDEKATQAHSGDGIPGLTLNLIFLCQHHLQIAKKFVRELEKVHWEDF